MGRWNSRIGLTLLLGLLLLLNNTSRAWAYSVGMDWVFREEVATCDFVIVGKIVETLPFDSTTQERISVLEVEHVLCGGDIETEYLEVNWLANRWRPREGIEVGVACGGGAQFSELIGVRGIWMVRFKEDLAFSSDPVVLSTENEKLLYQLERNLKGPTEKDLYARRLSGKYSSLRPVHGAVYRFKTVEAYITRFLNRPIDER